MTHPHQSVIKNPPQCFFTSKIAWLESKTIEQLRALLDNRNEYKKLRAMSDDEFDDHMRFEHWCKKNKGLHGRAISEWEAMEVFKDDIYKVCISKMCSGESKEHFKSILWRLKNQNDKLDIQRAKSVSIENLMSSFGYEIKGGFTCCQLHGEKTPSLKVYPETNTWHCFGCGEGSDTIDFMMKHANCNFQSAVKKLTNQ